MLLVIDPDFEDACRVLHPNGYKDIPIKWINATAVIVCCKSPDLDLDGKKDVKMANAFSQSTLWGNHTRLCKLLALRSHV